MHDDCGDAKLTLCDEADRQIEFFGVAAFERAQWDVRCHAIADDTFHGLQEEGRSESET